MTSNEIITKGKSSFSLYKMQKNLCKLVVSYGHRVDELKNKVYLLADRPLIQLHKVYESGDYTTVLFTLLNKRK